MATAFNGAAFGVFFHCWYFSIRKSMGKISSEADEDGISSMGGSSTISGLGIFILTLPWNGLTDFILTG